MPTEDLARFCCQNPGCSRFGQRNGGNLLVLVHFARSGHRLLFCRTCRSRCSEFKGTPFFNSKLPHDKVMAILQHLAEGCGIRQTARLVGVNKDTVTRFALIVGPTLKPPTMSWWLFPPQTQEVQLDERWAFVGKK